MVSGVLILRDMRAVKIMRCRLTLFVRWLSSIVCTTAAVRLENLALRHQIAVYQQSIARPKLQPIDRLCWAGLSRLWAGWQQALEFVQPRTVLAWQHKRFRDHWRELSQSPKLGRPAISKEVRDLIQDMWRPNPTWGAPRIVGELRNHEMGRGSLNTTSHNARSDLVKLLLL
jgi:hypothetical protein